MRLPLVGAELPVVIAHRGASAHAPENTAAAFRRAFVDGARWLEADVQPTAEGTPVILHDDDLDRTTDGSGPVRATTDGVVAGLDAGAWFGPEHRGEPVPTLRVLLDLLPADGRLLLELKGPHTTVELDRLLATLEEHPAADRVVLQSFEEDVLRRLTRLRPGTAPGLLREEIDTDPVGTARSFDAGSYNPEVGRVLAHPGLVTSLHDAGIAIAVWTSDDPAEWTALAALGVDAIITNRPGECLAHLHAAR